MEITTRGLWTMIHGMGFGTLYLLACSGAIVELWRNYRPSHAEQPSTGDDRFLRGYLIVMAALAWLAVLTGAYVIYPWYRAVPPSGTTDLSSFPQRFLISNPSTIAWHSLGMEWKEYVAWIVPVSITMAAFVVFKYGRQLTRHRQLRNAVLSFVLISFLAAGMAGFFGAMLNKTAPVKGGGTLRVVQEDGR